MSVKRTYNRAHACTATARCRHLPTHHHLLTPTKNCELAQKNAPWRAHIPKELLHRHRIHSHVLAHGFIPLGFHETCVHHIAPAQAGYGSGKGVAKEEAASSCLAPMRLAFIIQPLRKQGMAAGKGWSKKRQLHPAWLP
eukprot:1149357-Pelagomonas_calceolata.AAC.1